MGRWWRVFLALGLLAWTALLAAGPLGVAPVGAEPSLDLDLWRGPCGSKVTVLGTGFAPNQPLRFTFELEGAPNPVVTPITQANTRPDGTIDVAVDLARLAPNCATEAPPGSQYRISARDATTGSLLAYVLFTIAAPMPTPALTLEPPGGVCATDNPLVVVRGTGFTPGASIMLTVRPGTTGTPISFPGDSVAAEGTLNIGIRLIGCGPTTPDGTQFIVAAYDTDPRATPAPPPLATASFTVGATTTEKLCFPEAANQCIQGRFLARWRASGGLAVNGYPLSGEFKQRLEDNQEYTVQYFERVRMEYHPENKEPNDILLGQFGRRILATIPSAPTAAASPRDGAIHFPVTGHNVAADFIAYWEANGSLAQFGLPLSEEFTQQLEDGKSYTVQYFERARFERHPENQAPFTILLGQFGRRILAETGGPR